MCRIHKYLTNDNFDETSKTRALKQSAFKGNYCTSSSIKMFPNINMNSYIQKCVLNLHLTYTYMYTYIYIYIYI